MSATQTIRTTGKWLLAPLGLLLVGGLIFSLKRRPDVLRQLRADCQTRYAAATTRADSILIDNWIPAPELQGVRRVQHCSDLGFTYRVP
jgi:hypothetical protein